MAFIGTKISKLIEFKSLTSQSLSKSLIVLKQKCFFGTDNSKMDTNEMDEDIDGVVPIAFHLYNGINNLFKIESNNDFTNKYMQYWQICNNW